MCGMEMEMDIYPAIISETYVFLNELPYDNREWLNRTGHYCRHIAGTDMTSAGASFYCAEAGGTDGNILQWQAAPGGGSWITVGPVIKGVRVAQAMQDVYMVTSKNAVYHSPGSNIPWAKLNGSCREITGSGLATWAKADPISGFADDAVY